MSACRLLIFVQHCRFPVIKPDELAETRAELGAFVQEVFAPLPRAD